MPRRNKGPQLWWNKRRESYYVRWYVNGKPKTESTGTDDPKEAELYLADFLLNWRSPEQSGPIPPEQRLIIDCLNDYIEEHADEVKSQKTLFLNVKSLAKFWTKNHIADITPAACNKYVKDRGIKPSAVRRELQTLQAAINWDFNNGRITRTVKVSLPARSKPKERWITRSEAAALIREARKLPSAKQYLPLYILMALYTGQRKEAILSLKWIQIQGNLIYFQPEDRDETKKKRPTIPIHRRLKRFIEAKHHKTNSAYVFGNGDTHLKDVKKSFQEAAINAGLIAGYRTDKFGKQVPFTDVTPHTLRHSSATWMAMKDVSMERISRFIGHDDIRTTERIYAKYAPSYLDDALAAFD